MIDPLQRWNFLYDCTHFAVILCYGAVIVVVMTFIDKNGVRVITSDVVDTSF